VALSKKEISKLTVADLCDLVVDIAWSNKQAISPYIKTRAERYIPFKLKENGTCSLLGEILDRYGLLKKINLFEIRDRSDFYRFGNHTYKHVSVNSMFGFDLSGNDARAITAYFGCKGISETSKTGVLIHLGFSIAAANFLTALETVVEVDTYIHEFERTWDKYAIFIESQQGKNLIGIFERIQNDYIKYHSACILYG